MKTSLRFLLTLFAAFSLVGLATAADRPQSADPSGASEIQTIVQAIGSLGSVAEPALGAKPASPTASVEAGGRTWQQSLAIVAAGAAAGASIGAATRRGRQAVLIGAAAGAAAGLIYDRATAHAKQGTTERSVPPVAPEQPATTEAEPQ